MDTYFYGLDGTAAYTWMYFSLYPDVLQLIPDGTAAYIIKVITSAQLPFAMLQMGLWLTLEKITK